MLNKKKSWFERVIYDKEKEPRDVGAGFMHMLEPNMRAKLITVREMKTALDNLEHAILDESKEDENLWIVKLNMLMSVMDNNIERDKISEIIDNNL